MGCCAIVVTVSYSERSKVQAVQHAPGQWAQVDAEAVTAEQELSVVAVLRSLVKIEETWSGSRGVRKLMSNPTNEKQGRSPSTLRTGSL